MIKWEVICTYFVLLFHLLTKRREEYNEKDIICIFKFGYVA